MVCRYKYGSQERSTHTVTDSPLLNCSNIFHSPFVRSPLKSYNIHFKERSLHSTLHAILQCSRIPFGFIPIWLKAALSTIDSFIVFQCQGICSNVTALLYLGQKIPRRQTRVGIMFPGKNSWYKIFSVCTTVRDTETLSPGQKVFGV